MNRPRALHFHLEEFAASSNTADRRCANLLSERREAVDASLRDMFWGRVASRAGSRRRIVRNRRRLRGSEPFLQNPEGSGACSKDLAVRAIAASAGANLACESNRLPHFLHEVQSGKWRETAATRKKTRRHAPDQSRVHYQIPARIQNTMSRTGSQIEERRDFL